VGAGGWGDLRLSRDSPGRAEDGSHQSLLAPCIGLLLGDLRWLSSPVEKQHLLQGIAQSGKLIQGECFPTTAGCNAAVLEDLAQYGGVGLSYGRAGWDGQRVVSPSAR